MTFFEPAEKQNEELRTRQERRVFKFSRGDRIPKRLPCSISDQFSLDQGEIYVRGVTPSSDHEGSAKQWMLAEVWIRALSINLGRPRVWFVMSKCVKREHVVRYTI